MAAKEIYAGPLCSFRSSAAQLGTAPACLGQGLRSPAAKSETIHAASLGRRRMAGFVSTCSSVLKQHQLRRLLSARSAAYGPHM